MCSIMPLAYAAPAGIATGRILYSLNTSSPSDQATTWGSCRPLLDCGVDPRGQPGQQERAAGEQHREHRVLRPRARFSPTRLEREPEDAEEQQHLVEEIAGQRGRPEPLDEPHRCQVAPAPRHRLLDC